MSWRQYEYYERPHFRFGPKITDTVKALIIINVVIYLITLLGGRRLQSEIMKYFAVVPSLIIKKLYLWQLITYMFLHSVILPAGILHIAINMLVLWMLGSDVERYMGKRGFIRLYFFTGIGAALCHLLFNWRSPIPMIGASGAVLGVLIAFAMIFPERYIIFFFFPLKAKHLALGFAVIQLLSIVGAARSDIAYFAHLGGIFFGYIYMRFAHHLPLPFAFPSRLWWGLRNRFLRIRLKKSRYRYKPIESDEFISQEIDPILEKISKHGIKSLSRREKRILKEFRSKTK